MEETTLEKQTFTLDGKEYGYNELSDKAKACMVHIQKLDSKISEIQFDLDELNIARLGYITILKGELDKPVE